jgi:probable HAF family extracellular repeat protein
MTSLRLPTGRRQVAVAYMLALLGCAISPSRAGAELPSFRCERLKDTQFWPYSITYAINNRGDVTGHGTYGDGWHTTGGVVWKRNGNIVPLSETDTGDFYATGLNDAGVVAGYRYIVGQPTQAFIWTDGAITRLRSLLDAEGAAEAYDINSSGQVVGSSQWQSGNWHYHAVLWQDGRPVDLGTLAGDELSAARGINDDGIVAGFSRVSADGPTHAVTWGPTGIVPLPGLPGRGETLALGINREGVVIGYATPKAEFSPRPVAWVDGVPRDLGTLPGRDQGRTADINAKGRVVGESTNYGTSTATYWHRVGHKPVDLNSLVPGGCKVDGVVWPLSFATGINDKGVVAAYSQLDTQTGPQFAAFRLIPQ